MSNFRKLAHLEEQVGHERFVALIDSGNTGKVKEFCDQLLIPAEMIVGGRVYEILGILQGNERSVVGNVMVDRAKEMNANLGQEDCEHILEHQDEIPVVLRDRVIFIFPNRRSFDSPGRVFSVYWSRRRWAQGHPFLSPKSGHWGGRARLLHCKYLFPS